MDGGGVVFCLLYRFYSWKLPLTPPLNLMWKILKLPDSWSSRSAGCRSRHFYSALQVQPLQRSYSAVWTLLQHPGISSFTALRAPWAQFWDERPTVKMPWEFKGEHCTGKLKQCATIIEYLWQVCSNTNTDVSVSLSLSLDLYIKLFGQMFTANCGNCFQFGSHFYSSNRKMQR